MVCCWYRNLERKFRNKSHVHASDIPLGQFSKANPCSEEVTLVEVIVEVDGVALGISVPLKKSIPTVSIICY